MYADRITGSMRACLEETGRRREIQRRHNLVNGITPETIQKSVEEIQFTTRVADARAGPVPRVAEPRSTYADEVNREEYVKILEEEMRQAAEALDFERAALLRDQLFELRAEGDGNTGKGKPRRRSLADELREAVEREG
jgi:excinuclease ABC subunit B